MVPVQTGQRHRGLLSHCREALLARKSLKKSRKKTHIPLKFIANSSGICNNGAHVGASVVRRKKGKTCHEAGAKPMGLLCTGGSRLAEQSGGATTSSAVMGKGGRGCSLVAPSLLRLTGKALRGLLESGPPWTTEVAQ